MMHCRSDDNVVDYRYLNTRRTNVTSQLWTAIHSNKIALHEILRISRTPVSTTAIFLVSLLI